MLDVAESALFFAPAAMLVLSPDRTVRLINRAAEEVSLNVVGVEIGYGSNRGSGGGGNLFGWEDRL